MSVFVGSIALFVDEDELTEFLEMKIGKGSVSSCKINLHQDTARSRGFAFVDFNQKKQAMLAVKLSHDNKLVFYDVNLELSLQDRETSAQARPKLLHIEHAKLSIGCFTAPKVVRSMWSHKGSITIEMNLAKETLALRLKKTDKGWMMENKMEFVFGAISNLVGVQANGKHSGFLLQVNNQPPFLYCRESTDVVPTGDAYVDEMMQFMHSGRRQNIENEKFTWVRTTDFTGEKVIGQSFVYVLELPGGESASVNEFLRPSGIYNPIFSQIKVHTGDKYASNQVVVPMMNPKSVRLPFEHIFKINNLIQTGKISGPNLDDKFFKLVKEGSPAQVGIALQAMASLESTCYDPVRFFKEQLGKGQAPSTKLDKGSAWVHRLLITPTKVYCLGPEVETSNRIVRQYPHLSSHFLRVNFVDEDFSKLKSTALVSEMHTSRSEVYKRIRFILDDGLFIGYRNYDFLAFSASQLRDGQLWMFAPKHKGDDVTGDDIRAAMGNFSEIRNVAKCAARMGQCFSASKETRKVLPIQVKRIKDINLKVGKTTYCFSDGIGKISEEFAQTIAAECGLPAGRVPSAFQIRYGGYKGVVARDPRTKGSSFKLYLRPSMKKFDSPHFSLEVLQWTKRLSCRLNRQVISLLSTLGVPDSSFMKLQSQVVSKYELMMQDDALAMEVLQEELGPNTLALKMLEAGYTRTQQPLLERLLYVFKDNQLHELKVRASVPVAKGRLFMGCLDETNTLNYGEVFVKYSTLSKNGQETTEHVVTEKVFVGKNPCLHPGDIRVLQGVDIPALAHMVDCVVFPQRGPRPHPNECSGSDLDGDLYMVSWDQSLVPPTMDPAMDYTAPPATVLDHEVEMTEIHEFFADYMVNDNLGVISNAHVVHADKEPTKARSSKCLELAMLASMAVDFPKTGVPAVIPRSLRPKEYPDFMEKQHKTTYISHGILGKLYRDIKPIIPRDPQAEMAACYDKDMIVPGYEKYIETALAWRKLYDQKLIGLMNHYGIREEAEIVDGCILTFSELFKKKDATPQAVMQFKALKKEASGWFFTPYSGRNIDREEQLPKASAWYHVTYDFATNKHREHHHFSRVTKSKLVLLSFPWVVSTILLSQKERVKSSASRTPRGSVPTGQPQSATMKAN